MVVQPVPILTVIYTLVCPAKSDEHGKRVSGCGKGWESEHVTEPCSTCGLVAQVRDKVYSLELTKP